MNIECNCENKVRSKNDPNEGKNTDIECKT